MKDISFTAMMHVEMCTVRRRCR